MYKLTWKELNEAEKIVVKKKTFKSEAAFNLFVKDLWVKKNFLGIIL